MGTTLAPVEIDPNVTLSYIGIGPYVDTSDRNLRYGPGTSDNSYTNDTCYWQCHIIENFTYFSIQFGGQCFCDNDLRHATRDGPGDCGPNGGSWCNYIYSADLNYSYSPTSSPTEIPKCDRTKQVLFTSEIRMDDWSEKDADTSWRLRDFINDSEDDDDDNNNITIYFSNNGTGYSKNEIVTDELCLSYSTNCYTFELFDKSGDGLSANYKNKKDEIDYWLYLDQYEFYLIESDSWNNGSYLNIDFCLSMFCC